MIPLIPRQSMKSSLASHLLAGIAEQMSQLHFTFDNQKIDKLYQEEKYIPDRLYSAPSDREFRADELLSEEQPIMRYADPLFGEEHKFSIKSFEMSGEPLKNLYNRLVDSMMNIDRHIRDVFG